MNPFKLMRKYYKKPFFATSKDLETLEMDEQARLLFSKFGVSVSRIRESLEKELQVSYNRYELYLEETRALEHWLVGAAAKLYAEYATMFSQVYGTTVWPVCKNKTYENLINNLFERINLEEKIFDWAYQLVGFGDLFVKVNGSPGVGIVSIEDDFSPLTISRVDIDGVLVGFYHTPLTYVRSGQGSGEEQLISPWEYVHFRLLGARKSRELPGDPLTSEFRSIHLLGGSVQRQISAQYGTSILADAIAPYKRLRLAEDSLLLARATRGIMKYIYKIRVDSNNMEAVSELIDQYVTLLKRARAVDLDSNKPFYNSKSNPFASVEDILLPVWGETGDIAIERIGGEPDIKWIADITELRNQLATALKCPLALLGGYIQEASGQLGSEAIEQLDICFARNVKRIQRALICGLTRLVQIDLAYQNMDPDTSLFSLEMLDSCQAEDQRIKKNLLDSVDLISKLSELLTQMDPEIDKKKLFDILNQRILKFEKFNLSLLQKDKQKFSESKAYLPIKENCQNYIKHIPISEKEWEKFKDCKIIYGK